MKVNEDTVILGSTVILVPYEAYHVEKYHEWMMDEDLRVLTASEKLTLEDEFAMQRSWREDEDKCTFIVLDKEIFMQNQGSLMSQESREVKAMIGDVNLFIINDDDDDFTDDGVLNQERNRNDSRVAEVELMIAEPRFRRKGRGGEAARLILRYGADTVGVKRFVAKIGVGNDPSRRLLGRLGFNETGVNEAFQEVTMKAEVKLDWIESLRHPVSGSETVTSRKNLHRHVT